MDFTEFLYCAFYGVPNLLQSLFGMGVMLLMSCILLEENRTKDFSYCCLQCFYGFGKYVKGKNNISFVWGIHSQYKYSGSGKYSKSVWNRTYEFCIFINSVYFDAGFS